MKLKKILALMCCAVLLVCISVGATVAYLTATTEVVNNTFSYGKVEITLDEAPVDEYGVADTAAERVKANTYKLIPGHTYAKDPTVHVEAGSEESWLFVKVVDGIVEIEDSNEKNKTIAEQMAAKGWTPVASAANVWAYGSKVKAGDNIVVFDNFTVKGGAEVEDFTGASISVQAYAVQADGFDTAVAAWDAANANWEI